MTNHPRLTEPQRFLLRLVHEKATSARASSSRGEVWHVLQRHEGPVALALERRSPPLMRTHQDPGCRRTCRLTRAGRAVAQGLPVLDPDHDARPLSARECVALLGELADAVVDGKIARSHSLARHVRAALRRGVDHG